MHWWQAVILGVVEGLTEFLPVSSTGHLILASKLLGLPQTEFLKSFEIAIQLGAILAVIVIYWRKLLEIETLKKVAVAFVPTAAIGFVCYPFVKKYFLSNSTIVLWSLLIGGIVLILFDRLHRENTADAGKKPSYAKYFGVGVIQALSIIPGVSRSGATILGGLALGFRREAIVEFSFLLAVPVIIAATALDLVKNSSAFADADWTSLWIGGAVSFVVALAAIKFFLAYVRTRGFTAFGVYRILAAVAFWLFVR